mgnify:CR=1 FL=1
MLIVLLLTEAVHYSISSRGQCQDTQTANLSSAKESPSPLPRRRRRLPSTLLLLLQGSSGSSALERKNKQTNKQAFG